MEKTVKKQKNRQSHSGINVTDSVTGGKVMKKRKRAQADRGLANFSQMKTATAITVR